MLAHVGGGVAELHRDSFGPLDLSCGLAPGMCRPLTLRERKALVGMLHCTPSKRVMPRSDLGLINAAVAEKENRGKGGGGGGGSDSKDSVRVGSSREPCLSAPVSSVRDREEEEEEAKKIALPWYRGRSARHGGRDWRSTQPQGGRTDIL